MTTVRVAEVGMIPFCKPGSHQPYRVMAAKAIKVIKVIIVIIVIIVIKAITAIAA
jgi:hypothetical protein